MNAAELFVKCLENEGVEYIFGLPGEELRELLFALRDSSITFIVTRHEQGAAFMADVYGRVSGKSGVCLATLGPGATNLLTGIADAHLDHAPLVAITAQGSVERLHKESHQVIDVVTMFKSITKWNTRITASSTVNEAVRKAFKVAEMEKPGPTHLELPEDVAAMDANDEPLKREKVRRAAPDHKALFQTIELINSSTKPLILAGNGAIRKLASNQLRLFVEKTGIPLVSTFMGKGAVSDEREESLMTVGLGVSPELMNVFAAADLVISVGYDIAEIDPIKWNPNKNKKIVHIDFSSAEVYEYYQPSVEVVADISNTFWFLNEKINKRFSFPEAAAYRQFLEKQIFQFDSPQFPFHPKHALLVLRKVLPSDVLVISDVGAHKMWVGAAFPAFERGSVIISNGCAAMGVALPGAIGAKLAAPDRDVVAVMGDGGFLMNVQELETAVRLGIDILIVLFNDNSYSLIEAKFVHDCGETFGTDLRNPDFGMLARAFGCGYWKVDDCGKLEMIYREALQTKGVRIVEVPIDKKRNEELFG